LAFTSRSGHTDIVKRIKNNMTDVIVIGGGAAGIFAAIHAAEHGMRVIVLEKTGKLLSKVRISGGGRCNVTHQPLPLSALLKNYPRGGKKLKPLFAQWNSKQTMDWFTARGVDLKIEDDGRVFPVSDNSEDIIQCLLNEAGLLKVDIRTGLGITRIVPVKSGFEVHCGKGKIFRSNKVIAATGGSPKLDGLKMWRDMGIEIMLPVPSLFTFNIKHQPLTELMGLSVPEATVYIPALHRQFTGPLLITHWGMSGPAILKLSAFAARELALCNYHFDIRIRWIPVRTHEDIVGKLKGKKLLRTGGMFELPKRLWQYLCTRAKVRLDVEMNILSPKEKNRLAEVLLNDIYQVQGKSTYKEEFVTAGGISLSEINIKTCESKRYPGLFMIGELIDIDGITGGFNFQAAWASGMVAGRSAASDL
jgi:predicted Rossmann fold flavoprotein